MALESMYATMDKDLARRLYPLIGNKTIVHGQGPVPSKLMLIGEAPGMDEDQLGEPFCGRCGDLLTKMLTEAGIDRTKTFITNVVKCRPTSPDGKKNRPPKAKEIQICKEWLWEEIKAVKPTVIMPLGKVAANLLLSNKAQMKDVVGKIHETSFCKLIIPTYHPSFIMVYGKEYMGEGIEHFKLGAKSVSNNSP